MHRPTGVAILSAPSVLPGISPTRGRLAAPSAPLNIPTSVIGESRDDG